MAVKHVLKILGIEPAPVSHAEKIVSACGGSLAIAAIIVVSRQVLEPDASNIIIASMGASAVLLFAVPHGTLSQPWAVFAGHLLSAFVGVSCALLIPDEIIAASLAVGGSIAVMYYLKCLHPPGGATALSAVLAGDTTQSMAYQFMVTPVLINVIIILSIALIYNYLFHWRRYPRYLQRESDSGDVHASTSADISHSDFQFALSQIDSFVDVSEDDLRYIYELARQSGENSANIDAVKLGSFYSNGEYGGNWAVRQVVDESQDDDPESDIVIYKGIAGRGRRTSGYMKRSEFLRWARYEVSRDEENWKRVVLQEVDQ